MCSLIFVRAAGAMFVAANRDERVDRPSSPPAIWQGRRRRLLSPIDHVAGGTWLAVDDAGRVAGLTNIHGEPAVADAPSRGHLPHLALDQEDTRRGVDAVLQRIDQIEHAAFQLVVADRSQTCVIRHVGGVVSCVEWRQPVLALTNQHAAGAWTPRGLSRAVRADLDVAQRLDALTKCLQDRGGDGLHAVCKHGHAYRTVSSSLLALPWDRSVAATWRYAEGPPDVTAFRDYGDLSAQL